MQRSGILHATVVARDSIYSWQSCLIMDHLSDFFIWIMINYNNILKKYHLGKYRMVKVATFQMSLLLGITSRDGKLSSMNVELYNNYSLIWSINISIIDTDKSNSRKQFDKKQWHHVLAASICRDKTVQCFKNMHNELS